MNDSTKLSQKSIFTKLMHEMSSQDPRRHLRWRALHPAFGSILSLADKNRTGLNRISSAGVTVMLCEQC